MDAVLIDFDDTIVEVSDEARALRTKAIVNHSHWADYEDALGRCEPVKLLSDETAIDALTLLGQVGVPTAIVSHSPTNVVQRWVSERLDVLPMIVGASDFKPSYKPEPASLLLALERLGVEASERVLHVGDQPVDHAAAQRAGAVVAATWNRSCAFPAVLPHMFLQSAIGLISDVDRFWLDGFLSNADARSRYVIRFDPAALVSYGGPPASEVLVAGLRITAMSPRDSG